MTKRQFVVLAFRLFALYLVFSLISNVSTFYQIILRSQGTIGYLAIAIAICIFLAAISLLWTKSEWLMQKVFAIPSLSDDIKLVPEEPFNQDQVEGVSEKLPDVIEIQDYYETPLSKESLEIVVFSAIGLFVSLNTLLGFIREIVFFNPLLFSMRWNWEFLIPYSIQLALGIWLFLRPWQFQAWVEKFKPKPDETEITSQE